MGNILKEITIMLLVCLVGILLFAVVFYEYIPNRKVVPEVTKYAASEQVQQALADDIDKRDDQIVLTYEVTSSDLNNYKNNKKYVPGKANPFASVSQDAESTANTNIAGGGSSTSTNTNTNTSTNKLIDDGGIK